VRFHYHEIPSLPALAWCARVDRHDEVVPVFHGSGVETHPSGFVEGAWNGCFAALNFIDATIVAGTGGTLAGDSVRFSTSTDPSSPIFSIATRGSVYVSNSPSFALAAAGERPDDIYPFYPYDLLDIFRKGLGGQAGPLRLSSSTTLHVHFLTIVCVDAEGALAFEHHRSGESPGLPVLHRRAFEWRATSRRERGRSPSKTPIQAAGLALQRLRLHCGGGAGPLGGVHGNVHAG
jgi:hypothetical protein